jgi:DNA-binding response OmpR family regulator
MAKNFRPVVLVADDEPSTRALVAGHLRAKGYKVIEAGDGDEAWELAHEHLPHAVVLDVMMPGMSGWEVCRKIREAVSLAHTGVVMLTGIGENLNELTSPLYGADAYVDKPFEFGELDQKLAETLARRGGGAVGRPDGADQHAPRATGGQRRRSKPAAEPEQRAAAPIATERKPAAKRAAKRAAQSARKPAERAAKPAAIRAAKPAAKRVAKPAAKPAKRAAKPAKRAAKPAKRAAKPAKRAAKPAKRAAKPAAKRAPRRAAKRAAKPAKRAAKPAAKRAPRRAARRAARKA